MGFAALNPSYKILRKPTGTDRRRPQLARRMRRVLFVLAALAMPSAGADPARAIESAGELVNSCQELEKGREGVGTEILIPGNRDALTCWGYMQAMQDLSVLVDQRGRRVIGSCPPEQTTSLELIQVLLTYARTHANELDGNAAALVIRALQEKYPCPTRAR
jgi:Rap1a immunity proteins